MSPQPFILTLGLDAESFAFVDGLRQQHFPADRNIVPAHITLFHDIPDTSEAAVRDDLRAVCAAALPLTLVFPGVRSLGKGVAVTVDAPDLLVVRKQLAGRWAPLLSAQDRQPYRPHVTIQNKVPPDEARRLFRQLSEAWVPVVGRGTGLLLWYYWGGPWELAGEFPFGPSHLL